MITKADMKRGGESKSAAKQRAARINAKKARAGKRRKRIARAKAKRQARGKRAGSK